MSAGSTSCEALFDGSACFNPSLSYTDALLMSATFSFPGSSEGQSFRQSHTLGECAKMGASVPALVSRPMKRPRTEPVLLQGHDHESGTTRQQTSSETTEELKAHVDQTAYWSLCLLNHQHDLHSTEDYNWRLKLESCDEVSEEPTSVSPVSKADAQTTQKSPPKHDKDACKKRSCFTLIGETVTNRRYTFQCPDEKCPNRDRLVDTPWLVASSNKFRCTSQHCRAKKQKNNHTIPAHVMREHLIDVTDGTR